MKVGFSLERQDKQNTQNECSEFVKQREKNRLLHVGICINIYPLFVKPQYELPVCVKTVGIPAFLFH